MKIPKEYKVILFKAFLKGLITKEELRYLSEKGVFVPPIPWIFENEEDQLKDLKKREIIRKVFGINNLEVFWIKS